MDKYNLVEECWIPTNAGMQSLEDVFVDDSIGTVGSNSTEQLCLLKLLFAIGQAANDFKTNEDIYSISREDFRKNIIDYLKKSRDKFWLYSDEHRPFLQFPELQQYGPDEYKVTKELRQIDEKTAAISTNGKQFRDTDWTRDSKTAHIYIDAEKAMLLVINMGASFSSKDAFGSGKIVKLSTNKDYLKYARSDGDKGVNSSFPMFNHQRGLLHGFVIGESLLDTVLLNMMSEEFVKENLTAVTEFGVPPWEYEAMTEDCSYRCSFYSYLIPMNRFICMLQNKNYCLYTEGIVYNNANCKRDNKPFYVSQPSIFYYTFKVVKKTKNEEREDTFEKILEPSSAMHPLVSLQAYRTSTAKNANKQIKNAIDIAGNREMKDTSLLVLGTQLSQGMEGTALEAYVSSSVDVDVTSIEFDKATEKFGVIYDNVEETKRCISRFFKSLLGKDGKFSEKELYSFIYSKFDTMKSKMLSTNGQDELKKFNSFLRNEAFNRFTEGHRGVKMNPFEAMSNVSFSRIKYSF